MHAALDILTQEGDFSPKSSLTLVKAMNVVVERAQFVTVPVLDSRLAELRAEFRIEMNQRFAEVDVRFAELRHDMNARFAEADARTEVRFAQFETKLAKTKNQLVFWILGAMIGNNYLPQIVSTLTDAIAGVIRSFQ